MRVPPPYSRMIATKAEAGARASTIVSAAFQMGLAAYRRERLYDIERADAMEEKAALAFAGKVEIVADESLLEFFPATFPAEVEVDRRAARRCASASPPPTAIPAAPLDDAALADKAKRILGDASAEIIAGRPGRTSKATRAASGSPTRCGKPRWTEQKQQVSEREDAWRSVARAQAKSAPKKSSAGSANAALKAVIDDLVAGNRILYNEDVVDGYGHISARDPRDPSRFLLSRARAPGLVVAADIMKFGMDGEPVKDDGRPIYSERFIHSEIYKARPDVNSVVHTHSPTVVPFSVTNEPLRPIRAGFFYPEVPVFDTRDAAGWTDLLISNPMLGKALAEKLGNNSVVLLRGHGNAVVAPNVRVAVYRAIYTEANAKLLLQAKLLGGPIKYLAPEEAALMNAVAHPEAARPRQRPHLGAAEVGGDGHFRQAPALS